MQTKIYKCNACGAILCIPANAWEKSITCPTCSRSMIQLDDEFDLSEIISEDIGEKESE